MISHFGCRAEKKHWIEHHDLRTGVLNFDTPNVVLVGAERIEARKRRLAEREAAKAVREQREAIEAKLAGLNERYAATLSQVREAEEKNPHCQWH